MSQEASAEVAPGGTGTVPPRLAPPRPGSAGSRLGRSVAVAVDWLRSDVFLRTESGPVGWRKILLALACVIGGAAVSLSRTVGPGSLNTIWIEDAKNLLSQALNSPFTQTVKTPISGYYQLPARVITEIAIRFPLSWVPVIMSAAAALQYAVYGLVAYIASGPYLRSPWLRLLIAAPVCVIPLAYTQANNDLVTVQFIGLYGAFWTLLWVPGTRAGRILSPLVLLSVSSTAALAIVLAPLVVARLIVDRSKNAIFLAVFWVAGVLLQMSLTLEGKSKHYLLGFNGPLFVLKYYAGRVVPRAIFGESALGGPGANYRGDLQPLHIVNTAAHIALIGGAWAVRAAGRPAGGGLAAGPYDPRERAGQHRHRIQSATRAAGRLPEPVRPGRGRGEATRLRGGDGGHQRLRGPQPAFAAAPDRRAPPGRRVECAEGRVGLERRRSAAPGVRLAGTGGGRA